MRGSSSDIGYFHTFPHEVDVEAGHNRALQRFAELTVRVKATGRLRAGFAQGDLVLLVMANGGIVTESTEATLAASRRLVASMLSAFGAETPGLLAPAAPRDPHNALNSPRSSRQRTVHALPQA